MKIGTIVLNEKEEHRSFIKGQLHITVQKLQNEAVGTLMSHELAPEYNNVLIEMFKTYIDTDVKRSKKIKAADVIDQIGGFINHLEQLREVKQELG